MIGCNVPSVTPDHVLIYGHGGLGFDNLNATYPPNTVGAMKHALGFYDLDGIEVDIQFTQEGEMVVFHDTHLESKTQCKGRVNTLKISEVEGCNYRGQFYNNFSEQVISFDSLISLANTHWQNKYLSLNVQAHFKLDITVDKLAQLFAQKLYKFNSIDHITTECSDANFLYYLKENLNVASCLLVGDIDSNSVRDVLGFELDGLVASFEKRNEMLEQELADSSKKIMLYGQKSPQHFSNYTYKHIYGIQVDNPIAAIKYFREE